MDEGLLSWEKLPVAIGMLERWPLKHCRESNGGGYLETEGKVWDAEACPKGRSTKM